MDSTTRSLSTKSPLYLPLSLLSQWPSLNDIPGAREENYREEEV